jgi:hypothetical protein
MGPQLSRRGHGVAQAWPQPAAHRPAARPARAVKAAQHDVEAAAARYRELRAAAAAGPPRRALRSWQQLLLLVVGGGVVLGVVWLWLLATMYLGYVALIMLPVIIGLAAMIVARNREERAVRRPCVEDLVRAMRELREAEAAARRAHVRDGTAGPGSPQVTPPAARRAPSSTSPPDPAPC